MRYYTLLHGTRSALEAAALLKRERSLFGGRESSSPESGFSRGRQIAMEAQKLSLPDTEIQGRELLSSELSRLFTAVQSPSMSLETGLDNSVGELRTVVSTDYREASGLPCRALAR